MFSEREKGLSNRLKTAYPHIIVSTDLAHNFNLICKYALKKFPDNITKLVKQISKHFSRSLLRRATLKGYQKDLAEKDFEVFLKVLTFTESRWSTFLNASQRI